MVELSDKEYQKLLGRVKELEAEREGADNKLKVLEEKWRSLLKNCPDLIVSIDRNAKILFINHTISGIPVEEVIGRTLYDFMSPEATDKAKKAIESTFKTGKIAEYEIQHQRREGGIMWLAARVGPNAYKDAINSVAIVTTDISERKRAEKELEDFHSNLSSLLENTDDYILICDRKGFPVRFNLAYASIMKEALGIEMKPGIQPHKLLPDKSAIAWWDSLHRRVLSGEKFREMYSHDFGEGDVRYFEISYHPIIKDGEVLGFTEVTRNVTEHENVKKTLKENEKRHRQLLDSAAEAIVMFDVNGRYLLMNKAAAKLVGGKPQDFLGKTMWDTFPEKLANERMNEINQVFRTGEGHIIEVSLPFAERKRNFISSRQPIRDRSGKVIAVLILGTDITERKRAEKVIETEREKLKDHFEIMVDGVVVNDEKGNIIEANKSMAEMFGYKSSKEMIGKRIFSNIAEREALRISKLFEDARKKKELEIRNLEVICRRENGSEFTVMFNICHRRDKDKYLGSISVARDITEQKQMEEILKNQKAVLEQKNVALREIIAQIEVEKNKIKDDIKANVDELLLPILKRLGLKGASRKYIDLLKRNLEGLTSSFGRRISEKRIKLTPREIEICDMIKGGLTSKEVSSLLHISLQTIEKHRKNIRQKLRISNKNINLVTFLQQF